MKLENCAVCGGEARLNSDFVSCTQEGCRVIGPNLDHDCSKWNALMRAAKAGKTAEPTLGETIIERLTDFEQRLAALRSDVHDKALHGIGAIGLRVTTLEQSASIDTCIGTVLKAVVNKLEALTAKVDSMEAWRESHTATTEQPQPEPYIPYRDEVGLQDISKAKAAGKKWFAVRDVQSFGVYLVSSEGKEQICEVQDLRERPTADPVPELGWRPCTETPVDGERVVIDHVGKRWIRLAEVIAAIEAAEVPELERRMDERFPGWYIKGYSDGLKPHEDKWVVYRSAMEWRTPFCSGTQAAAMRAALGDKGE